MVIYRFKTELSGERTKYSNAVFTTGDVRGYRLVFEFTQNGKKADLTGCMLSVKAKRADGVVIIDSGVVTQYEAYCDVKSSMISAVGDVSFEIALADSDGMYLTALELIAFVREGHGEADLKAVDTTPVLSTLLSATARASESARDAMVTAENAFSMAQTALDSRNYSYNAVNMASVFSMITVPPNTITYAYGIFNLEQFDELHFPLVRDEIDDNIGEESVLILDLSSMEIAPTIIFTADGITWLGGEPPLIEAGKIYMFSFTRAKIPDMSNSIYLCIGGEFR